MPEFQGMSKELQEHVLAERERLMQEAMNPERVVTRSINELGFWEGLKETVKPHVAKQKEIMFKELKANASLALSLIPVLGEGKGLGTGLFGVTVKAGAPVEQAIKFEPFVRGKKALEFGKRGYNVLRGKSAAEQLLKFEKTSGSIFTRVALKGADVIDTTGAYVKDAIRSAKAALGAKTAVERSVVHDFTKAAKEGATVMATKMGVEGIQAAQRAKAAAKEAAMFNAKHAAHLANAAQKEWYKFPIRWARSAKSEVVGRLAAARAGKEAGKAVTAAVESTLASKNAVGRFVEGGVKRAAPAVIEGTKYGKFHAIFDKWLNLTPDVPIWLSTTTGVAEFLGAHGIDAIPAVMQMAVDRYQQIKVSKDMALDVLGYTVGRVLRKSQERKAAAEVFPSSV